MIPLLMLTVAAAQDVPADVQAWSDKLALAYSHYASVEPAWEPDSDLFPRCPTAQHPLYATAAGSQPSPSPLSDAVQAQLARDPAAVVARCEALRPGDWRLQLRMKPVDQRVFSPLLFRVSHTRGHAPAAPVLAELLDHGLLADTSHIAVIPVGSYLVELSAPCAAGPLIAYELHDAVTAVVAAAPDTPSPPPFVAWSPCGQDGYERRTPEDIAADARKPRDSFGLRFPQQRERVKHQSSKSPFE